MTIITFKIPDDTFEGLIAGQNLRANGDIGKLAVKIVELYFKGLNPQCLIARAKNGPDIEVTIDGVTTSYEVKGTAAPDISWSQLKVSSQGCFDALQQGVELIRVSNLGKQDVTLYFMKCNVDFRLEPEPRWTVKRLR